MAEKAAEIIDGEGVFIIKSGTPVFIKTEAFASMIGTSKQWVGKLTSDGVIQKAQTTKGTAYFDLVPTMKSYIASLEERIGKKTASDKETESERKKAEASLKKAKAAIATMDAQERAGRMHRSEDVAALTEDLIFTIRGGLLALPGRVAVDVAAATTPAEASEIIRQEVYKLMTELSEYKYDPDRYVERVRERLKLEAVDIRPGETDDE